MAEPLNSYENRLTISFKKLHPSAEIPKQMRKGDSGFDLTSIEAAVLPPFSTRLVSTGLAVAIPYGYEGQIRARSSLAQKAIMVMNGIGTIDSGYRGEIKVLLGNLSSKNQFTINKGYRIAQLVIAPVMYPRYFEVTTLPDSDRGEDGFGSTGDK